MSLSEKDREILLQEIQEIQHTLEATGRNFESYASDNDEESEIFEGSSINEIPNWTPVNNEEADESQHFYYETKYEVEDQELQSATTSVSDFSYGASLNYDDKFRESEDSRGSHTVVLAEASSLMKNDGSLMRKFLQNLDDNEINKVVTNNISSETEIINLDIPTANGVTQTKSSLSTKVIKRIGRDSIFDDVHRKVVTGKHKPLVKSEDGHSTVDVSLPPSLASMSKKKKEQINMTNLYVERIFRDYRNNKNKLSGPIAMQGHYDNLRSSADLSKLENLLQVNRHYQDTLKHELKKVVLAVYRNRRAQDELTEKNGERDDNSMFSNLVKSCIGRFGNPYFKDGDGEGPPDNEDTKEKRRNLKAGPFVRASKPWKHEETVELKEGVYQNNLGTKLEPLVLRLKEIEKACKGKTADQKELIRRPRSDIMKKIAEIKAQPQEEILMDAEDIDFFKISKNYVPNREEFECRLQWLNVIHPNINQKKFSKEEDALLIKLAKKHKNHNWEVISKALGTNRTPVQCLQRFQRTLNKEMIKTKWDPKDDTRLKEAVGIYGNCWVSVANYVGNKLSDQCMHRWGRALNPNIKRGKWTEEEDKILIAAVEKHGLKNWKTVKLSVPGRTDAQCRERYVSSLDPEINWSPFTPEEDTRLLALVDEYGTGKWSKIAKKFSGRRDSQIWRRYKQLESEKYFTYRREKLWKKNSVMNYFGKTHRRNEKRDYEIEELEVSYSPSINHVEAKKMCQARENLLDVGLSSEETTKRLARMHFNGEFANLRMPPFQHQRKGKQRPKETPGHSEETLYQAEETPDKLKQTTKQSGKTANRPGETTGQPGDTRKSNSPSLPSTNRSFSDENIECKSKLIADVAQLISSVDDPAKELTPVKEDIQNNKSNLTVIRVPRQVADKIQYGKVTILSKNLRYVVMKTKCERVRKEHRAMRLSTKAAHEELDVYETVVTHAVIDKNNKEALLELIKSSRNRIKLLSEERRHQLKDMLIQDEFPFVFNRTREDDTVVNNTREDDTVIDDTMEDRTVSIKQEPDVGVDVIDLEHGSKKRKGANPRKVFAAPARNVRTTSPRKATAVPLQVSTIAACSSPASTASSSSSQVASEGGNGVVMSDQLRTFTLLLQALHVDTAGVMKTLPQNHLASSCPSNNSLLSRLPFPTCYPLSPNESSLHGFRTLLLHRRTLGEIVKCQYGDASRDRSYQKTRSYQALQNRFRSVFLWPAFLATFIPKYSDSLSIENNVSVSPTVGRSNKVRKRKRSRVDDTSTSSHVDDEHEDSKDSVQKYIQERLLENNKAMKKRKFKMKIKESANIENSSTS